MAYLLATEDQPLKGNLIVLMTSSETSLQGSGIWFYFDRCFKGSSCSKGKKAIWIDCSEDLLSYFAQQGFRDEAESDRGVHMVWER